MKINLKESEALLEKLNSNEIQVSLTEFLRKNVRAFQSSGLSKKTIYDFLKENKINLSSYHSFRRTWLRVQKQLENDDKPFLKPEENLEASSHKEGKLEAFQEPVGQKHVKQQNNLGLRPIHLPDGTEVEITPSGAKKFKI